MIPASSFLMSMADAAARSLLLAAAVGAGLWILRVRNVVSQKAAWILVLAASFAMPLVARWAAHVSWLPDRDTFVVTARSWSSRTVRKDAPPVAIAANAFVDRQPETVAAVPAPAFEPSPSRFPAPAISYATSPSTPATPVAAHAPSPLAWLSPARALLLLYIAVCAAMLLRLACGAWVAVRLWRLAKPVSLESPTPGIPLRSSRAVASPVTVGAGVILPADHTAWDAEKLRIVLAHEISHVRQRDFVLQLAASFYIALFWFNPLGWWLKRRLSCLAETISDGAAVHQAASHASYAQVLLEFAALPRPISIGVAMAHRGHIRSRIEHLLNESSFRQAFSGGRLRLAAAVLLVPVALFAATAMVRVQAAGQQVPPATVPPPQAGDNNVTPAPQPNNMTPPAAEGPAASAPVQSPAAPLAPAAPDIAPGPLAGPAPDGALIAPAPPGSDMLVFGPGFGPSGRLWAARKAELDAQRANLLALTQAGKARGDMASFFGTVGNGWFNDGNSYAYVTGEGEKNVHFSGNWYESSRDQIDKARKVAHGDFLWFERDGKSYVIDDPALLASLKPMQDQMEVLGKQQEELGRQQEELGKQQEALGKKQEEARVPTPDVSKEMADLNAAIAKLDAKKGGTVSQQDLGELQGKIAELEGKLGSLEGEMGARQGEFDRQQGELGAQQGKLGAQQGRLGAQQGRIAREMDGKVLTIIDESIKNDKARPVQ
ncbi:MAG TPA: M56 family metallopeptidase [Terracidiphilus sp.]|jgi:beta-lactamase regulating signal transducer with metallopeptidase domain|nr:M56 family metallopeptidase [Terracidiphilus sp.]